MSGKRQPIERLVRHGLGQAHAWGQRLWAPAIAALRPTVAPITRRITINRRRLLIGAAAGGGLLVAWWALPRHYRAPRLAFAGDTAFGAWLMIDTQGAVTVAVPQLEMGQGITTLLAQIVAAELGADWRQIAVQPAPVSAIWANVPLAARWSALWMGPLPRLLGASFGADAQAWLTRRWAERNRFMVTADGTAIEAYEGPARVAAASARALLAMAAAERWGVAWQACEVAGGLVRHGEQSLSFGALAEAARRFTPPDPPVLLSAPLAEPAEGPPPGTAIAFPRLDIPAKLDGSFNFAGDIRLPGMLYAAIRHPPIGTARLAGFDSSPARGVAGFRMLVASPDPANPWLAAVAENGWAAETALARIAPRFAVHQPLETVAIEAALDAGVRGKAGTAHSIVAIGDAPALLDPTPRLTQRYDVAAAMPAGLETATATARLSLGLFGGVAGAELWAASQAPEQTRRAVARALGIATEAVTLYPVAAGGSFDARLETPHAVEAALIARAAGHPVQLMWSRWQEGLAGIRRPPVAAELSARLDPSGALVAWRLRAALPAASHEFAARVLAGATRDQAMASTATTPDPLALEGAVPPYAIPNLLIEHVPVRVGLPSGRLRGNAHGYTAFFTECFLDEIATSLKREPLSFRIAMLNHDPRLAQCLERVSLIAGWNGGADGSGNGLACHRIGDTAGGGCIAAIATARRGPEGVRVEKIFAVADIGRIPHLDIARQQIEGGLVFGIGLALGASSDIAQGLPTNARLSGLALPVLADCPEIVVAFMPSTADPFDPGELGVAVAAPAIANALASATGLRFRKLPLIADEE